MDANRGRTRLGRLLAAAGVAVLGLLVVAPAALAEEPQRYNCPPGFVWIRMSGTACVQETVPINGKIGYDGHALCIDPYVGIYETRGTTDGKGVPGNPANSYAYLLECVTAEEFAARQAAGTGGELAQLLAGRPTELPDAEDLVVIGFTATGGILLAASRFRPPPKPPAQATTALSVPPSPDQGGAPETPLPLPVDPEEIRRKLTELADLDANLASLADRIRAAADAGQLSPQDYVTWLGVLADGLALAPIPPVQLGAGFVSISASLSLALSDAAGWDAREIYRDLRGRLDDIARMRGVIAADRSILEERLAAPDRRPEQVPGRIDLDPRTMPDPMLREERDRSEARVDQVYRAYREHDAEADRLMRERWQEEDKVRELRRILDAHDASGGSTADEVAERGTTAADLSASVAGFLQKWGEDAEREIMRAARQAKIETLGEVEFGVHARGYLQAEEAAQQFARGGKWASRAGALAGAVTAYQWWQGFSAEQQRVVIEQAIEQQSRRAGELSQHALRAEEEGRRLSAVFRDAVEHRNAIRTEVNGRALAQGRVLWTQ